MKDLIYSPRKPMRIITNKCSVPSKPYLPMYVLEYKFYDTDLTLDYML